MKLDKKASKSNELKIQLFTSIGIATVLIIAATFIFFNKVADLLEKNDKVLTLVSEQLDVSSKLDVELFKLTQSKMKNEVQTARNFTNSNNARDLIKNLRIAVTAVGDDSVTRAFKTLDELTNRIIADETGVSGLSQQEIFLKFNAEQIHTKSLFSGFSSAVLKYRQQILRQENDNVIFYKRLAVTLIVLAICIIVYTFRKIYQTLEVLRKSSHELKKLNSDFKAASTEIENTNWSLKSNAILVERLSGIDDESTISTIALDFMKEKLSPLAVTIYVRKINTNTFFLKTASGISPTRRSFEAGVDFLGMVVNDGKIVELPVASYPSLNTETSIMSQLEATVYLCPLVYEEECVGLMELSLPTHAIDNVDKITVFLRRISRNITTSLKFGQSHTLVEDLLEAQKQHTEELEAQQEELRITNEELIHKTHLLEASEEELRVQQEELSQTNTELNQKAVELERRNVDLNNAQGIVEQKIKEIEQASHYKSEFLANMSHELRTPLNSVLILAKLLKDNKKNNLTEEQVKYAGVIHSAGSDLLELINEILDLAKIESGKVEINKDNIYVKEFAQSTQELFTEIANDKQIEFTVSIAESVPRLFVSDEYRIQQVVKNFLSNAFKFTEKLGNISLHIFADKRSIHFQVKDTGRGIPQEKQEIIFEAFKQEDGSTSRKYGGTGLGLSISREIATLLDGEITLESEFGKGSTFSLTIPMHLEVEKVDRSMINKPVVPAELPAPEPVVVHAEGTRKILIIEDDINFAEILKDFAEGYGFEVILAHDGANGIKLARQILPDAVILDVMLPISDGWEVLNDLKKHDDTKHIPIHMMSAASFSQKEFLEKGAIGFMHKPVSEDVIRKTFDNINLNLNKSVRKILLVEDQEIQSDFIKNTFSDQNINVIQAFSIASGLNKLKEDPNIDCIILDLQLPDGNGLEFIEKIKESKESTDIPIIINTASEIPKEQYEKLLSYTKATVLKSGKSTDRLIDEVNLFLNKLNTKSFQPLPKLTHVEDRNNSLQGKTVLIADDDMRNVFALSTALQAYEMKIEIANNGLEAIKILEDQGDKIDIVLMDIMMPEMDGYQAIEKIRGELKLKKMPVIAVTAKAMKGDKAKSIEIGANDYVSKPIDMEKLTSLMQIWLS